MINLWWRIRRNRSEREAAASWAAGQGSRSSGDEMAHLRRIALHRAAGRNAPLAMSCCYLVGKPECPHRD